MRHPVYKIFSDNVYLCVFYKCIPGVVSRLFFLYKGMCILIMSQYIYLKPEEVNEASPIIYEHLQLTVQWLFSSIICISPVPYLKRVNGLSSNNSHCKGIKMLQFMKHAKEVNMNDKGVQSC